MQDFVSIFFRVVAVWLFLYLNWRNLGDNYEEKKLVTANWVGLLGFMLGARLAYGFANWGVWNNSVFDWWAFFSKPGMIASGGYVGFLLVTGLVSRINGWKYWSFLEDSVTAFLWFLICWKVGEGGFDLAWLLGEILLLLTLTICWFVAKKYRSFWWYKSGKKGFVFLTANLIFGLGLLLMAFVLGHYQSQMVFALMMVLLSAAGLFILGEGFKKVS